MDNYKVLEADSSPQIETSRPNVVGSKRALKKEHGSIDGMVAKYLRFMVNQWNTEYNTPLYAQRNPNQVVRRSAVEEILLNYKYYQSQQDANSYAYLTETSEGEERPARYTHGSEIYQVVQHMVGPVIKHFASTTITIESLDPSVQSKRQTRIAMLQAKKDLPEIFKRFAEMGANFVPEGPSSEKDMDAAIQKAMRQPAHKVESFGMDILNHVNNVNSVKDYMPKRFKDVIIGRHCGTHVTTSSGRILLEQVSPWNLIFDRDDQDDDYNRYSLFKGFVSWKTREEIMQAYTLGPDAAEALKEMFDNNRSSTFQGLGGMFSEAGHSGFNWMETDGTRRIACVTGYFVATLTDGDNDYYNTIYQGTLIGNTVLVNFGESNNISYDMARPEWPVLPIHIFSPDTVLGRNVCPVDRFRHMQEDCDAFMYKIREHISRDLGKGYVFYSDSAVPKDIIEDLKNFGVTVVNRADPEEPIINNNRMVDTIDMTLDPNVSAYVSLRKEMRQDMKDVVSQSSVTQGMQQTYIGGGTQQATIAQAGNGTVALMSGFFQHFAFIEQHVLNTSKTMLLEARNREEAEYILSDSSADFWESLQDINVMDMQVRIEMEDFIDDERRQRYQQYALAMAQNAKETGFTMLDALAIENSRTSQELYRKLKEALELKEMKTERQRQEDMQMQMGMQQQQQQMQGQMFQLEEQNKAMRDQIRNAPKHEANQIKREELGIKRDMAFASDAGMPGTEVE
jgi:hypothetical protein